MILAPTDNLTFNVNFGYLDTGYDEITVPTGPSAGYVAGETEFSQAPERDVQHRCPVRLRAWGWRLAHDAVRLLVRQPVLAGS